MKRIVALLLTLMALLLVAKTAQATSVFYFERTAGGTDTINSTTPGTGSFNTNVIGFTYIKGLKINAECQFGKLFFYSGGTFYTSGATMGDFKVGYPVINQQDGLLYITGGFLTYTREETSEAVGGMLGLDIVSVLNDNVNVEWELQYSLFGSNYGVNGGNVPLEITSLKFNILFILTDHLGLSANIRYIYFYINKGTATEDVFRPSLGVVYRF